MTTSHFTDSIPSDDILATIDLRSFSGTPDDLRAALPRIQSETSAEVAERVAAIDRAVRERGFDAIHEFSRAFDGVDLAQFRVPEEELVRAAENLDAGVRAALQESAARVRTVSAAQRPSSVTTELSEGSSVTLQWRPLERIGVYVPGGLAVYPSSVVMTVVPAQVAGVGSIALFSPPQAAFGGAVHPTILAAAQMLGITEVYAIGGAPAVSAMAHGVPADGVDDAIERVSLIAGPANIYGATAKRLVRGQVAIDSEAGPTEIAIVADDAASAEYIAADLISQTEHDPNAGAVLFTDSLELAALVQAELKGQLGSVKNHERALVALRGQQSGIVLTADIAAALAAANAYAAEHLEIMTSNPRADLEKINNAGAVFLGSYSPVSLGDYCAGSNHVLPTSGTATFSSGLSVYTYLKAVQVVDYSRDGLELVQGYIRSLSDAEALYAHGDAVDRRFGSL